ncbi:MAG: hypothetical protein K2O18_16300 [Oscillospiraceae bacterium]|nr:hypothetical protein [Oscillospiraceae bacterium]
MPEDENMEQTAAPQEGEAQKTDEQPDAEEQERLEREAAAKAAEKQRNSRVSAVLTMLICLCLIAEVALVSYIGLTLYQNHENQKLLAVQYEAYLEELDAQRQNPPKVQYIGPTVRVIDGVLVEDYPPPQLYS